MRYYIKLLRPHQWLKNIFVFAPLFFSNNILKTEYLFPACFVFVAFCFISSSIYCINDIHDAEADRLHPEKCKRPIASGNISSIHASLFAILLALISVAIVCVVPNAKTLPLLIILLAYWLMNIAYSFKLKQYGIIDIFCIAIGFVLRVLTGGLATGIWISQWIVLLTFLIALFLALTKRYDDCCIFEATGMRPRKSITTYNKEFVSTSISIIAAITSVCYIMYTLSDAVIERTGNQYLYLTSVWVLAGLLRYVQNMIVYKRSKSPTKLLINDTFLHLCIIGWLASFIIIIYV